MLSLSTTNRRALQKNHQETHLHAPRQLPKVIADALKKKKAEKAKEPATPEEPCVRLGTPLPPFPSAG
ncbi:hypothetical protein DL770_009809 [Monosporascus sp. CRB-9-2]|nr:hypothetical protein DL770_009809 [Monosporascus sp. CRB-9-2]